MSSLCVSAVTNHPHTALQFDLFGCAAVIDVCKGVAVKLHAGRRLATVAAVNRRGLGRGLGHKHTFPLISTRCTTPQQQGGIAVAALHAGSCL